MRSTPIFPWLLGILCLNVVGCSTFNPLGLQTKRMFYEGSEFVAGALAKGDTVNPRDRAFLDEYPVSGKAGQILIVGLESATFDAYLEIVGPDDKLIAFNDDAGPDVNAYLAVRLPRDGIYRIRATTFDSGATGDYTLSYGLEEITWQQTLSGRLEPSDARHPDDESPMDTHTIEARAGQSLMAEVDSSDFDAFVQVLDPEGRVIAQDDDQGGNSNALTLVHLDQDGTYTLRVNAYKPPLEGDYTLRYSLR